MSWLLKHVPAERLLALCAWFAKLERELRRREAMLTQQELEAAFSAELARRPAGYWPGWHRASFGVWGRWVPNQVRRG